MRIVLRYDKHPFNRQVTGALLFSQMEHIHQKQQGQSIVGHHGTRSLTVVISGPEATAGSMWIL